MIVSLSRDNFFLLFHIFWQTLWSVSHTSFEWRSCQWLTEYLKHSNNSLVEFEWPVKTSRLQRKIRSSRWPNLVKLVTLQFLHRFTSNLLPIDRPTVRINLTEKFPKTSVSLASYQNSIGCIVPIICESSDSTEIRLTIDRNISSSNIHTQIASNQHRALLQL